MGKFRHGLTTVLYPLPLESVSVMKSQFEKDALD